MRQRRIVMGVCLVGVAACFFAAPLWSRLMMDQSMVDVRAQGEKAPLVFRGRVLTVGPDPVILPNLGNRLLSEVRNGVLRQFVQILSAAGLAPKTIVNVVTVVKLVVASAVNEEGDRIHLRIWNHEFIQLPLVIKETQKHERPARSAGSV